MGVSSGMEINLFNFNKLSNLYRGDLKNTTPHKLFFTIFNNSILFLPTITSNFIVSINKTIRQTQTYN